MSEPNSQIDRVPPDADLLGRRTFVRVALGGVGLCYAAAIGYPVYRYMASPVEKAAAASAVSEVTLKDAGKLAPGSVLMFKFGTRPTLLIHHTNGKWVALDAVCTHLGCTVQYEPAKNRIHCACHDGIYDPETGRNVGGPPPRPLKQYQVTPTDAGLVISRI